MTPVTIGALWFAYGPVLAAFGCAAAWLYRWGTRPAGMPASSDRGPAVADVSLATKGALVIGFVVLASGHFVTLVAPGAMQALLGDLVRVALLEAIGLVAAFLFTWGVAARFLVRVRAARAGLPGQKRRAAALGVLLATCASGVLLTLRFRWIVAWYATISVPYLRSLIALDPKTDPIVASPWPIQAHVLLFMVLVAAWPLAGLGLDEILPWRDLARGLVGHDDRAPEAAE